MVVGYNNFTGLIGNISQCSVQFTNSVINFNYVGGYSYAGLIGYLNSSQLIFSSVQLSGLLNGTQMAAFYNSANMSWNAKIASLVGLADSNGINSIVQIAGLNVS